MEKIKKPDWYCQSGGDPRAREPPNLELGFYTTKTVDTTGERVPFAHPWAFNRWNLKASANLAAPWRFLRAIRGSHRLRNPPPSTGLESFSSKWNAAYLGYKENLLTRPQPLV